MPVRRQHFGIWVTVDDGVTGRREAWLKGRDRDIRWFDTREEAEQVCTQLRAANKLKGGIGTRGRPKVARTYEVRPLDTTRCV